MSWLSWAVIAAVFWGLGPVFAKLGLVKPDPLTALTIRTMAVMVILLAWGAARGGLLVKLREVDPKTWLLLCLEGAFASVIAHFAYFSALKVGNVANVVPVTASYPMIAAILAAIVSGAKITPVKLVGILLTVAGVYILQRY